MALCVCVCVYLYIYVNTFATCFVVINQINTRSVSLALCANTMTDRQMVSTISLCSRKQVRVHAGMRNVHMWCCVRTPRVHSGSTLWFGVILYKAAKHDVLLECTPGTHVDTHSQAPTAQVQSDLRVWVSVYVCVGWGGGLRKHLRF